MSVEVDVTVERVIACPRDRLAAFAADPSNAPDWYANIKAVRWETAPSTEPGARAAFVARFLGRDLSYTYEIREHVAGELLVMSTAQGPFPMQTTYRWSDAGPAATLMRLSNRGRPAGFKTALLPIMRLAMRRAMTKDLAALARIMEPGG
ncbi:MAG: SRPBCC family protein [Maritimibacter sp.]|nr:SRPBCC family protein [Maritimibacter sp.]